MLLVAVNLLILAAGYATRPYPLTRTTAKPLIPVAGRPMLEHVLERFASIAGINRVFIVTNQRFAADFQSWAEAYSTSHPGRDFTIVNDGSLDESDKLGAIGDILKNGLPMMSNIGVHARALAESSLLIAPAFEKNISAGATDAKPEIWQQADKFNQSIDEMREAALQLAAAIDEGNTDQLGDRVKALGRTCGSCHKSFRKPKEESYKNK